MFLLRFLLILLLLHVLLSLPNKVWGDLLFLLRFLLLFLLLLLHHPDCCRVMYCYSIILIIIILPHIFVRSISRRCLDQAL